MKDLLLSLTAILAATLASAPSYAAQDQARPTSTQILDVPVSTLRPGNVKPESTLESPVANDKDAAQRGMSFFIAFNCVGCHAPNGGGGMGPSLSNKAFIYGGDAANIFLSILQGRPNGMPAWRGTIPESSIWDLAAYVQSLSDGAPSTNPWGRTISREAFQVEQVPGEYAQSATPWQFTQPFSFGQKPNTSK